MKQPVEWYLYLTGFSICQLNIDQQNVIDRRFELAIRHKKIQSG